MAPVFNSGIAFGINFPFTTALKLFFTTLLLCLLFFKRKQLTKLQRYSLVFILIGGLSNLFELILFEKVRDYFCISNFSCFNFADIAIVGGSILFIAGNLKKVANR